MKESLYNVLKQIVVPHYDKIVNLKVEPLGRDWFRITYYFDPPMENKDAIDAMEETSNLFRMMGPDKESDIIVSFEKNEKD